MTENERLTINGKEVALYREVETNLYRFSKDAVDMLLEALEEREQYRAIGTVEEILKVFNNQRTIIATQHETLKQYRAIGTIEEFKALKEKNEPKEMDRYYCPICRHYFEDTDAYNYCPVCGQKMKPIWQ